MEIKSHAGLFEGIGGFTIGAQRNKIETKWVCELDSYKRKVLKNHFPNATQFTNIRHLNHPPQS